MMSRLKGVLKQTVTGYIPPEPKDDFPYPPPPLLNPIKTEAKPEVTEPLKQEESHESSKMLDENQSEHPEDPVHLGSAFDLDVRPYELVDAIVVHTNWETQVDKLVKIIREGRRVDAESSPSPAPSLSPSLTKDRVPSESSPSPRRVDAESPPSPKDSTKTTKKAREDSVRVPPESSESSGGSKT
jgi:hypothetical protein